VDDGDALGEPLGLADPVDGLGLGVAAPAAGCALRDPRTPTTSPRTTASERMTAAITRPRIGIPSSSDVQPTTRLTARIGGARASSRVVDVA
jgi:hypothetical protein